MWYVLQVRTGTEESIRLQCRSNIPEAVLERCFIPYYEEKKRIRGEWTIQKKVLFPGYVFAITEKEKLDQLFWSLKNVIGLTKLIGTGQEIVPLTEEEKNFLIGFGGEDQVVEMSEGVIEGDKTIVTKGPLMGKEGFIRKIDRHKRVAWIEYPADGSRRPFTAGLEILSKT